MGWRSSHGARRDTNGPVRIEVKPADEMGRPNAEDMDVRLERQRELGRPFKKGNRAAAGRRPKLARLGIDRTDLDSKDPAYAHAVRIAESYRQRRVSEMKIAHGFASVGAMSIMATASLQLAFARMMMAKAGEGIVDMDLLKKGSSMANDGRQNELAAWELCEREASAKTRSAANQTPWLAPPKVPTVKVRVTEPEVTLPWEAQIEKAMVVPNKASSPAHLTGDEQEGSGSDIP